MARTRTEDKTEQQQIRQIAERCVVDRKDFGWWLDQKGWHWRALDRGEYGISLEQAQLLYVMEDPVLWCRAFLTDPDTGQPYEFWDYQRPSIRAWDQNVVHQDGAEVGKTREIIALILWGMCTSFGMSIRRPSILVGAPQQTHLDEIIMAMEEHLGVEEDHQGGKPIIGYHWRKPKKTPHYMARFRTPKGPGRVYFRPSGHDGEAFRGVHVNAMALFDESAKAKHKVIWSEFFRAMMPGCKFRCYSVPDGDRQTDYYRMCQEARLNLRPGEKGMRLFHWPKTIQPESFWNQERKEEAIQNFGGEGEPGYQRNVLGLHGQQENPVFPWPVFEPNLRHVPEYRCLRLTENTSEGSVHVQAYEIELKRDQGKKHPHRQVLADRYDSLSGWRAKDRTVIREVVNKLLREFFEPLGPARYWLGADLGLRNDPTEIRVWQERGDELRCVGRIHAKHVSYDVQCELIYCLDRIHGQALHGGIDMGSAGAAVMNMLYNLEDYEDAHFEERLTGFNFGGWLDAVDEEGEALIQTDQSSGKEKAERLPAKHLATDLLLQRMQRVGFAYPYDRDTVSDYSNHTAREGTRFPIYAKKDDHVIDADRLMMLRRSFDDEQGAPDLFASGSESRAA
ncbi:hypothetical protein [Natronospira bacteriovora]|uniref:Phage terminase large subunit-like protein n=1 Tax=Natronospira bacteriovora TaxID=3069753 RepID=A0ABU0W6D6_9GAMM|nr:hypothetical protein [Natronospira sp. AB-CW4]MDQ2069328.1 hypothetical protein [Natronospira sp. AB-CW4]